jgi:hypothetical protein
MAVRPPVGGQRARRSHDWRRETPAQRPADRASWQYGPPSPRTKSAIKGGLKDDHVHPVAAQNGQFGAGWQRLGQTAAGGHNGGYRLSHYPGAVTVGNGARPPPPERGRRLLRPADRDSEHSPRSPVRRAGHQISNSRVRAEASDKRARDFGNRHRASRTPASPIARYQPCRRDAGGFPCTGCLGRRPGRRLTSACFPAIPLNSPGPESSHSGPTGRAVPVDRLTARRTWRGCPVGIAL